MVPFHRRRPTRVTGHLTITVATIDMGQSFNQNTARNQRAILNKFPGLQKGVRHEGHCRLVGRDLRQATIISSNPARARGLANMTSRLGLRLLALGSIRSGQRSTNSLELVFCPSSTNKAVNITLASSQLLPSNCGVVLNLNVRGIRPLAEQPCNIFSRIKLQANKQNQISVCTITGVFARTMFIPNEHWIDRSQARLTSDLMSIEIKPTPRMLGISSPYFCAGFCGNTSWFFSVSAAVTVKPSTRKMRPNVETDAASATTSWCMSSGSKFSVS